ncbi:M1 family metallopeptidase [Chryseosolibacter indicus]|uniref:M1 family metallopeptidase n=1 Tax=Chryseosolibacter indicus TaxID=2782351 RepID=A0ABS5W0L9_9BACT|nr:M1 family metallopeptidase [Chryseosolibacter indicus]MBT1705826.1 M1 family metallopeptidase [Chryseosolibacter indicus]
MEGYSQKSLPVSANFKNSYRHQVRDTSGLPGHNYWQNRADYIIDVHFSPETRVISGSVLIQYQNNSPDTLTKIVFKLYPNLYKTESVRSKPIRLQDLGDGLIIDSMLLDNLVVEPSRLSVRGTNMTIKEVVVPPGGRLQVKMKYSYTLNQSSFIRTGQVDTGAFVIAYFFPRITVYDDIDGWNEYPYLGYEEFYNDYGNFDVNITVPDNYQVWCTGSLSNTNEVFDEHYAQRIAAAERSDSVVDVITKADLTHGSICKQNGFNTWRFQAADVPDVAFCVSNHYVWKSASVVVDSMSNRRVRVDAIYNPDHKQYNPVINYAVRTVKAMSYTFPAVPFPYTHISIFDGLDAMEYPMMVNNLPWNTAQEVVELTAHEIFHTLFPFYVGTNETKYSFMDEGLATLAEFTLHPLIAPEVPLVYDISVVNEVSGTDYDYPIITLTPQLHAKSRYVNKDLKPALGFYYVKEMLGEKKFSEALRFFIMHWKGKHPSPYDLFNCINTATGDNLNWFWEDWFLNKISPDLSIGSVNRKKDEYAIEIRKLGNGIVPIHLRLYFEDGSDKFVTKHISCWSNKNDVYTMKIRTKIPVTKITLGGDYDVDIDKTNNVWEAKGRMR